jgi:hypothetical protein
MRQLSRSAFPCNQLLLQQTGGILLIFDWGNGRRYDLRNLSDIAKKIAIQSLRVLLCLACKISGNGHMWSFVGVYYFKILGWWLCNTYIDLSVCLTLN